MKGKSSKRDPLGSCFHPASPGARCRLQTQSVRGISLANGALSCRSPLFIWISLSQFGCNYLLATWLRFHPKESTSSLGFNFDRVCAYGPKMVWVRKVCQLNPFLKLLSLLQEPFTQNPLTEGYLLCFLCKHHLGFCHTGTTKGCSLHSPARFRQTPAKSQFNPIQLRSPALLPGIPISVCTAGWLNLAPLPRWRLFSPLLCLAEYEVHVNESQKMAACCYL